MNFSFSSDQQLLKNSARAFLDEHMKPATVRLLWDDPRGESEALWKEMGELGWLGLSLPEAHGGSGVGMVETAILLEEMGHAALPGPYLPTVLAAWAIEEAGTNAQRMHWLSAIATGEARATLALLDADLDWRPEGTRTRAEKSATGWTLSGTKRFVPWAHVADVLLVPARTPDGLTLFLVDPAAAGLTLEPAQVMDGTTRLVTVTLDATPVGGYAVLGAPGQADALLAGLLRRGAVGAAAEMLGAARRCLDMAVGYAKVREQFGQPIGSFQAIRHKCAEMLLEVENSHAAVYYSAWALDARAEDAELAASVAKAYVGDAARRVCGEAIQVHGGIGFTWEYDLHLYFKRAISVDLKTPEGRAIVERLATGGDVFMENMRPGVAERLGVGWTRFAALNPRLVYCSVTAFGSTGPGAERPGFDPIFQALGGLMTLQGFGGPPQYLRTAPTDYYTAALATQAILAALFTRERTGRGQRVETSLLRGVLALQSGVAVDYPGKPSLVRDNPTYRLYQAGDGQWFFLAVGNQSFWVKLTKALGLERVADNPRFGSWLLRIQNNADLLPILEARFREKPRTEWLELLAAPDIPAAPVQPLLDFFEDPAVRHHDLVHEYEHPEVGRLRLVGQPIAFTETPTRDPGPPPTLGQHTDEILRELGYPDAEIAALRARRVLGGPRR